MSPQEEGPRVSLSGQGWQSDVSGNVETKGMGFGLDKVTTISKTTRIALAGSLKLNRRDELRLNYHRFNHEGTLTQSVTFYNRLYRPNAKARVESTLFDVGAARIINQTSHGSWKVLVGATFSHLFMQLSQAMVAGTRIGKLDTRLGMPYLGLAGETRLAKAMILSGSAKYCSLRQSGGNARISDYELALLIGQDDHRESDEMEWYGKLGYRYFLIGGTADGDSATLRYAGPTFGLETRF